MISGSLDYIPINFIKFIKNFFYIFYFRNIYYNKYFSNETFDLKKYSLYGYSCRSLFHTLLYYYTNTNKDLKILTTPIHHKSFRNIIELFIKKDNITILNLNDNYNKIIVNENIINKEYDLCIITHLFGQDLDITDLNLIKETNPQCVFIEDRVQGGLFHKIFSDKLFDISLYSTGMDKKPCGLGGGIIYFRDFHLYFNLSELINKYKEETKIDRFIFLLKKIPTYLLYNCRLVIFCILKLFRLFQWDLYKFASSYRKNNPGFQHDNYNLKPNISTIISIENSLETIDKIENLYTEKFNIYINEMKENNLLHFIPWYNNNDLLTVYNTIYFNNNNKNNNNNNYNIIKYFNDKYIPIIENPTYKLFTFDYINKEKDITFNDSLYYIPCLMNLNKNEIEEVVLYLSLF